MKIEIKHNSKNHVIELPDDATLGDLKTKLAELTKVPPAMQKLTGRPNLKDDTESYYRKEFVRYLPFGMLAGQPPQSKTKMTLVRSEYKLRCGELAQW